MIKAFVRATQTGVHLRGKGQAQDAAGPAASPSRATERVVEERDLAGPQASAPPHSGPGSRHRPGPQSEPQAVPAESPDLRPPEPQPLLVRSFFRRVGLQLLLKLKPSVAPFLHRFQARVGYALDRSEAGLRVIELERRLARLEAAQEAGFSQLAENGREIVLAMQASSHKIDSAIASSVAREMAHQEMRVATHRNEHQYEDHELKKTLKRLDDLLMLNGQKGFELKWEIEHSVKAGLDELRDRLDKMQIALARLDEKPGAQGDPEPEGMKPLTDPIPNKPAT